jgi:hypothetical protein
MADQNFYQQLAAIFPNIGSHLQEIFGPQVASQLAQAATQNVNAPSPAVDPSTLKPAVDPATLKPAIDPSKLQPAQMPQTTGTPAQVSPAAIKQPLPPQNPIQPTVPGTPTGQPSSPTAITGNPRPITTIGKPGIVSGPSFGTTMASAQGGPQPFSESLKLANKKG